MCQSTATPLQMESINSFIGPYQLVCVCVHVCESVYWPLDVKVYVNRRGAGRVGRWGRGERCIRKGTAWEKEAKGAKDRHSVAGLKHTWVATSPALK